MSTNCLATNQLKQFGKADEGQALVLGALALVVLVLMAGLGVDVGFLRYQKLQMQKAADAGAIAAASALITYGPGGQGEITAAAQNDTSANGFTNGKNGISVKVNNPPQSGPFTGDLAYVEVIVAQVQPTFFMRLLGSNYYGVNVRGRAVSSSLGSASSCIFALDPTDADSLIIEGRVSINSNCGIRVNSSSSAAFEKRGSGNVTVSPTVAGIGVVGLAQVGGSGTIDPTPVTGIPGFGDPLSGVPAPAVGNCKRTQTFTIKTPQVVPLGVYCGGISVETNGLVSFESGTYVLFGGLAVQPNYYPTLIGNQVTFYNTGSAAYPYAPITITGSASSLLTAPTSGPLAGILVFQDRSIVSNQMNTINASRGELYTGALYFPTTPVTYTGNATFPPYLIIDAWQIRMRDTSAIGSTYESLPNGASPIHSAILVE